VVEDASVTLRNVFRQPSHYAKNCGTFPYGASLSPDRPGVAVVDLLANRPDGMTLSEIALAWASAR
jgi:hypothetical protein